MTRIISGEWRGHTLPKLKTGSVRPTTDRARTILFDTLRYVQDFNVLDLYSGTGALGFEALSRGASSLTSIDMNPHYIKEQKSWIKERGKVFNAYIGEVFSTLKRINGTFDLILADPPYAEGLQQDVIDLIESRLAPDGLFVYETSRHNTTVIDSEVFELLKEKVVAETRIQIYKAL